MDQEAQQRIMGFYTEEARDHLMNLEQGLVSLRDHLDDSELINDLFRAAHSIKGGAAMLGLGSIQKTAHRLEDTFKVFRERQVPVDDLLERLLLQAYDSLANLLDQLQTGSLTEHSGEAVVQAAEPTFSQLEHHLQVLLGEASPAAAPVAAPASAPDFNQVVSQRLRDMLEIVKKGQPDARQQLQSILTSVAEVGSAYGPWQDLVATIQTALAIETNDLRMLALVFLRDLKAAQQLISEGQVAAVQPSADLLAKLPVTEPEAVEVVASEPAVLVESLAGVVAVEVAEPTPAAEADIIDWPIVAETEQAVAGVEEFVDDSASDPWADLPELTAAEQVVADAAELVDDSASDPWADLPELAEADADALWGSSASDADAWGMAESDRESSSPALDDWAAFAELPAQDAGEVQAETSADPWGAWEAEPAEATPAAASFDADNPYNLSPQAEDPWAAALESPAEAATESLGESLASELPATPDPEVLARDPLEDWLTVESGDAALAELANMETGVGADVAIANLEALESSPDEANSDPFGAWLGEAFEAPEPVNEEPVAPAEPAAPVFLDDLTTLFASDGLGLEDEWQDAPVAEDDTELGSWMADLGVENDSAPSDPDTEAEMLASIFDTPPPPPSPVPEVVADEEELSDFSDLADLWNTPANDFIDAAEVEVPAASADEDTNFAELNALFADSEAEESTAPSFDVDLASLLADEPSLANESADESLGLESLNNPFAESLENVDWSAPSVEEAPEPAADIAINSGFDLADLGDLLAEAGDAAAPADEVEIVALDSLFVDEPVEPQPVAAASESEAGSLETDLGDLEAMLSDTADTEMDALSSLLEEPAPTSFDELESLLGEPAPTSFDELEDLLGEPAAPQPKVESRIPVTSPRPAAPPAVRGRTAKPVATPMMRVEVKYLDTVNNLVGELVVSRNSLEQTQGRLRQFLDNLLFRVRQLGDIGQKMQDQYERSLLESSLLAAQSPESSRPSTSSQASSVGGQRLTGESFDALEMDRFTAFHSLSQEVIELIVRIRESASDIEFVVDESEQTSRQFRQITTQLQEGLNRVRMVPFSQIADRLPRAVKDLSFRTGKQISLSVDGRDTLIDKSILEELYDPMTHLVNNAIVHGIEDPTVRASRGKPVEGTITIRTFYQGNQTIIAVSDDGGGIDAARVKKKAVEKGMITAAQAATMDDQAAYELLGQPGFSTKDQADELAGRGVGLDVVVTTIREKMRGTVQIDSQLGKGTTFTLRLPLTLSVSKAMVCISDRALVAFPLDGVEEMIDVPRDQIQKDTQGRDVIPWRDQTLHFQPLSQLLSFGEHTSRSRSEVFGGALQVEDIVPVVILQSGGQRVALQVDNFVEEQEIVIKQLGGPIPKPDGIAGATVLGNGRVLPIADTLELIDMAMGRRRKREFIKPPADTVVETIKPSQPTVLIVDDSITVRELLSMTFAKVGYRVEQARDGQDAWDKLRGGLPCDLVFCDIEMPKMDGLEFLSRVREDNRFTALPIAMLTSRGADRHRQMAASLGATAYFTKPYLEEELLSAANRMLQGDVLLASKA